MKSCSEYIWTDGLTRSSCRDLVDREEKHIQQQKAITEEMERREKAVAASEAIFSERQLEIQKTEMRIREETKLIETNRVEIQAIRHRVMIDCPFLKFPSRA